MLKMVKGKQSLKGRSTVACVLFAVMLLISTAAQARIYQNIVAFGDSLSDHYGLQVYFGTYDPVTNPNGVPEVWSDGDVWVEYLAAGWGASLENNAIGGAMTLGHESETVQMLSNNGTIPNLGLVGQVGMYVAGSPQIDSEETLFTIWIGANDLMEFGRGEYYTTEPYVMIAGAMTSITDAVVSLYSQGASHFLILNLPDIAKSPGYNKRSPEEIASVTQLVQAYNGALTANIEKLEASLDGITIDSYDMFAYLGEIIDSGTFVNVTDTYMELDAEGNKTGNVNGDAADYLFWDSIHPTTRAHEIIADKLDEAIFSVNSSGSSTCFIDSVNGDMNSSSRRAVSFILASLFLGMASIVLKKRFEKK